MRIDKNDIQTIKLVIMKYIADAEIFLFGSRVCDDKRGGDIDLFVRTKKSISYDNELEILTELELRGIDRKIDLIIQAPNNKERPIWKTASETGVLL